MNMLIQDIIAYEEQIKKQKQQELEQQREYAQLPCHDNSHEYEIDIKEDGEEPENSCSILITSL